MFAILKCLLPKFNFELSADKAENFLSYARVDGDELDAEVRRGEVQRGRPIRVMTEGVAEALVAPSLGVAQLQLIGSGGFSNVYQARGGNERIFAIKIQSAPLSDHNTLKEYYECWKKEVDALQLTVGHKNFVQLDKVLYWKHRKAIPDIPTHMAIKMEYLSIDIQELINIDEEFYQGEEQLRNMLLNHLEGIAFLHSKKVVHHDLKSRNSMLVTALSKLQLDNFPTEVVKTLLKSIDYKIIDMGLAEMVWHNWSSKYGGTMAFMSPEKLQAIMVRSNDNRSTLYVPYLADAYSIGCIIAHAAAPTMFDQVMGKRTLKESVPFEEASELASKVGEIEYLQGTVLLEVVLGLLEPTPTKRLSVERALQMLK